MTTIPNKITWPKGTRATIQPQKITPPVTLQWEAIDFTSPSLRWEDDPNGQTVTAKGVNGITIQIMGGTSKTPYNAEWQEEDARAALLAQLGLTVPVPAANPSAPSSIAPIAEPVATEKTADPAPLKASP